MGKIINLSTYYYNKNDIDEILDDYYTKNEIDTEINKKINIKGHTPLKNLVTDANGDITTEDKPVIPAQSSTTPTADTTNGAIGSKNTWAKADHSHPKSNLYAEASHSHGNITTNGQISGATNKNVVTDGNGNITTEAKPTIPSASNTTPSADTTNGAIGSATTWAKADHQHPISNIYAPTVHNHDTVYAQKVHTHSQYLTEHQDVSTKATYVSVDDNLTLYIGYDPIVSVSVTSDNNTAQTGQIIILSATVKTTNNNNLEGAPVEFYEGDNLLGTSVSGSSGEAIYTYISNNTGNKVIKAKSGEIISQPFNLSITASNN